MIQVGDVVRVHRETSRKGRTQTMLQYERIGEVSFISPRNKFVVVEFEDYRETFTFGELELVESQSTSD